MSDMTKQFNELVDKLEDIAENIPKAYEQTLRHADELIINAVDQTFDENSKNAQSGYAISQYYDMFIDRKIDKDYLTDNYYTKSQTNNLFAQTDNHLAQFDNRIIKCENVPIKTVSDNTGAVYQESEKDDTAVHLKFTDIQDENAKTIYVRTYNRTTETGANATSLGSSIATGKRSFAAGSSNLAAEEKAFATGCDNIVAGKQSFANGYANYVESSSSASFGQQNIVKGACSFVAGLFCKALGMFSTVFGNSNVANHPNQFVVGKFNENKADTVFEVGYGADDANRSNLFEVGYKWTGSGLKSLLRIGETELTEDNVKNLLALDEKLGDIETLLGGI